MCTLLCEPHSLRVCRRWPPIAREELRQSVDVLLRNSKLATYPKVRTRGRGRLAWATLT